MTLNAIDHVLVATLVFVVPWLAVVHYRALLRALAAGHEDARLKAYRQTVLIQWSVTAFVIGVWLRAGRSLPALGLGFEPGLGAWVGLALTLVVCGVLVAQVATARRRPEARAEVRAQIGALRPLLPVTEGEGRWFGVLSVTAGVCEEVIYRGFLMAYFAGLGTVLAILLSTLVFGLSHSYMGRTPAIRAGLIGLVVAGLYWLTGSLWASMLLHATADLTSGVMARIAFAPEVSPPSSGDGGPPAPPPPAARR